MPKRFLTLDELHSYYAANAKRTRHFSAKDADGAIVVRVDGNMLFDEDDGSKDGLTSVTLQACHTGVNRNKSRITDDVMEKALPSFKNRPILGYIHEVDGQYEFYDHRMHQDEDGEIVYDERPVGIISESCDAHLEYDEDKGNTYVVVNGYLFDEYSKASEILQREGECSCSVELSIREMSYSPKEKILNIEDFYFSGVTVLGRAPEGDVVEPGMAGANIKLEDFKASNSVFSQDMIAKLNEISVILEQLSINKFSKEGGENSDMSKFEELLEQYNVTAEEIDFDYESMSDEELETAFAEKFAEAEEETTTSDEEMSEDTQEEEATPEEEAEEEKFSKTFELSHEDIRYALYQLLVSYEDEDNDWYCINAVYDDHFVYQGIFSNNIFGQKFIKDNDAVSFEGDRWALHAEYLTDAELAVLTEMRANYADISEKLAKYESEPDKVKILESEDYANLAGNEAYEALKEQDNHFDLSVEEIKAQCDAMLLEYAKGHKVEFQAKAEPKKPVGFKPIIPSIPSKSTGKYGGIFSRNK